MTIGSSIPPSAPRRRRKEERPGEILEAGLAEFAARGFEAARMEDIARRAGVAKGTVFRYFPTKEALFEAAIRSRLAPILEGVEAAVDHYPGPASKLVEALVAQIHAGMVGTDMPAIMRMILTEGPRFPDLLEAYYRQSVSRGVALLRRIVARGVATGEFRPGAIEAVPMLLMAPALMAALWRLTFDRFDPTPPEHFQAAHLQMALSALRGGAAVAPPGGPGPVDSGGALPDLG